MTKKDDVSKAILFTCFGWFLMSVGIWWTFNFGFFLMFVGISILILGGIGIVYEVEKESKTVTYKSKSDETKEPEKE